jgi:membrane protease YdiL (CAAX protease family)
MQKTTGEIMGRLNIIRPKPFDLPEAIHPGAAIVLCLFYVLTPHDVIRAIVGACTGIYLWIGSSHRNILGLSVRINRSAKITVIIIVISMVILLPLSVAAMYGVDRAMRSLAAPGALPNQHIEMFELITAPGFPKDIHRALYEENLPAVLKGSIMPGITLVVITPVFESLLVFAILFPALWKKFGLTWAVYLIALLFMATHLYYYPDIILLIVIYAYGLIMAGLYACTHSLYPTILIHFWINLQALLLIIIFNWGLPPP